MLLPVNPNRMELLKLRKKLVYAYRGHDLLEDKLKQLLIKFFELLKETQKLKEELKIEMRDIFKSLSVVRLLNKKDDFLATLEKIKIETEIKIEEQSLLGIKIPLLSFEVISFSYPQNELLDWELVMRKWVKTLPRLIKLTQQIKTCQLLAREIESCRRRVNALEYLLIPSITQTINYIRDKLNELERASLLRLLRIKEIIRKK
jgi:V/A-type H+-transporting ATPase subunit D